MTADLLHLLLSRGARRLAGSDAWRWGLRVATFAAWQGMAQAVGLVTSVLVVRLLGKQDYAHYTICIAMVAAASALSNGGIGNGVTAIGGRVWQDPARLGQVIATAWRLRRWLAAAVALPVALMLAWLLRQNAAGLAAIAILVPLVLVCALLQLGGAIYLAVPRLMGHLRELRRYELSGAAIRLAATAAAALAGLTTALAMAAVALAYALQFWLARRWARRSCDLAAAPSRGVQAEMAAVVKRQWPNELFGIFQGQISLWLLSLFATVDGVADYGALGRIGVVFAVLGTTMQSVLLPRYARCQEPARLRRLYGQIMLGMTGLALLPLVATITVPDAVLWVLGPQYRGLGYELVLVAASCVVAALNGFAWNLNACRGWIIPPWINVPFAIVVQVLAMAAFGVSTLEQVVLVSIGANLACLAVNIAATGIFLRRFREARRVSEGGRC